MPWSFQTPAATSTVAAQAAFECALALDSSNAVTWNDMGNLHRACGHTQEAVRCYRTALELNPRLAAAWNNVGCMHLDHGDCKQASAHFLKAIYFDTSLECAYANLLCCGTRESHSTVLYQIGCRLVHETRLPDAVVVLTRAIYSYPANALAHAALGSVFHRQGRLSEARTMYEEAIRLAPGQHAECHINLGHLLRDMGDLASARVSFLNGIQLSGGNADDYNNLACVCKDLGLSTEAIAYYHMSLSCKEDNPNVHCNLVHSLMMLCDWREVKKWVEPTCFAFLGNRALRALFSAVPRNP